MATRLHGAFIKEGKYNVGLKDGGPEMRFLWDWTSALPFTSCMIDPHGVDGFPGVFPVGHGLLSSLAHQSSDEGWEWGDQMQCISGRQQESETERHPF